MEFIETAVIPGIGGHPRNVVFLTADAFGVLPPISKLTPEQAMSIDGPAIAAELEKRFNGPLTEFGFADHVSRWLEAESEFATELAIQTDLHAERLDRCDLRLDDLTRQAVFGHA